MRLGKGISKQGRKKSNKPHKANQSKVKIVYKPSPGNHLRLFKALSMLLNKEDILDYFDPQKNQKTLEEKGESWP